MTDTDDRDRFKDDAPFPPKPPVKVRLDTTMVEAEVDSNYTDPDHLMIVWSMKTAGFGQFYFYERDGEFFCDNECMGEKSVRAAVELVVKDKPKDQWPAYLQRFDSVDDLMAKTIQRNR